jgi:hypothetical protein
MRGKRNQQVACMVTHASMKVAFRPAPPGLTVLNHTKLTASGVCAAASELVKPLVFARPVPTIWPAALRWWIRTMASLTGVPAPSNNLAEDARRPRGPASTYANRL